MVGISGSEGCVHLSIPPTLPPAMQGRFTLPLWHGYRNGSIPSCAGVPMNRAEGVLVFTTQYQLTDCSRRAPQNTVVLGTQNQWPLSWGL